MTKVAFALVAVVVAGTLRSLLRSRPIAIPWPGSSGTRSCASARTPPIPLRDNGRRRLGRGDRIRRRPHAGDRQGDGGGHRVPRRSFDGILASLDAGKFDAVISALTITEERVARERPVQRSLPRGRAVDLASVPTPRSPAETLWPGSRSASSSERRRADRRHAARASVVSFDAIGAAFLDLRIGPSGRRPRGYSPTAALFSSKYSEIRTVGDPITRESYGIALRKTRTQPSRRRSTVALRRSSR